jgi:hypothetical protein
VTLVDFFAFRMVHPVSLFEPALASLAKAPESCEMRPVKVLFVIKMRI